MKQLDALQPIARAELQLRQLALLCLREASRPYRRTIRVPDWDRHLEELQAEFDAAVEAWQGVR